ncbi:MAG TPA: FAD-dependent oxidoreductase [Solirubrobacteraceae bacterium]|jgi:glycerol-3-phosphate dehydrogenase
MALPGAEVAVIGGGVVGCAVAHALARRGVAALVLESQSELALGASGSNSGILHTGFDSHPGELETRLLLRSAELRRALLAELGVPVLHCGARLVPHGEEEVAAVSRLAVNAGANGVAADLEPDGTLLVPGEAVTDPVALVEALAGAAQSAGASVSLGDAVVGLGAAGSRGVAIELAAGERWHARAAVNCAGLFADDVARMAGDDLPAIYPRKGEFLVFAPPAGAPLEEILLPVPSRLGKGVLVFPTVDDHVIAGPTARERTDKHDWSVEADAQELIVERARRMWPAIDDSELRGSYAGLRPAGRHTNYVIEHSRALPGLVHVAAIRSTGVSASLAIGEHVVGLLAGLELVQLAPLRSLAKQSRHPSRRAWWERAARRDAVERGGR